MTASTRLAAILALTLVSLVGRVGDADPRKALVDESTVTGGADSQEATIAASLGFEVTVVSDDAWGSLSAEDFGQYDLLIAGDPTCGPLPPGLIASAPVFGPVVLGFAGGRTLAGNRVLVGSDPVFHDFGDYTSPGARGTVIREGITFAGREPGRTGMYFDATCATHPEPGQSADILSILSSVSEGDGDWTIEAAPPCGSSVSLIASHPAFTDLTTASLQGWNCSVHESFPSFPTDWSALAVATDTTSRPTCGIDPHTGMNACGEAYVLIAGTGIVVRSVSIALSPAEATNPVDTDHTVTAEVVARRTPLAGQVVTFSVTGQNSGASGTCVPDGCVTDSAGNVSFTYHGDNGPGDDTIKASFTDAGGSLQSATAEKHWVEVQQPLPLTIGSVPDLTLPATSKSGATVTYTLPVASDGDDVAPPPVVICAPASGSLFPVGTTTVTCTATDPDTTPSTPSQVSTSFRVTVTPLPPPPPAPGCDGGSKDGHSDDHDHDHGKTGSGGWSKDTHHSGDSRDRDDDRGGSLWDRCVRIWRSWRS